MDLRQQHNIRENNAAQTPPPPQHHPSPAAPQTNAWWWPSLGSKILVSLLAVAAVIVLIAFALGTFGRQNHPLANYIDTDGWQAVFLSNGQVYFGKITSTNGEVMVLEDIYYLQVDQQIQPDQEGGAENQESNVSLAKLGMSELHGPQDQMFISMSEVVFWENLKDRENSRVVETIEEYKAGNGELPTGQPQTETSVEEAPNTEETETPEPIEP